jgi:YD repeat-containing protein
MEGKMIKKFTKEKRRLPFWSYFLGAFLAFSFIPVNPAMAGSTTGVSGLRFPIGVEAPQPIYLSLEKMKEMGSQGLPYPAPMQPKIIPLGPGSPSLSQPRPLTKTPSGAGISMPSQPMGFLTGGSTAGRTIFVYDNLNRLIRAAYADGTNIRYTYDKVGNRTSKWSFIAGLPCDFDNDRKTDISIYRVSNGGWYIIPSSTGTPYGLAWGGDTSDKPVPGDYDGDGKADVAVYRSNTGIWYILPSGGGTPNAVAWGIAGDKPVPGDYDGDGKTDLAIYRPSDGGWYIVPSGGGAPYGVGWGGDASDKLVPADYDGDGKTDVAIYRGSNGGWYIIPSGGGAPYGVGWGGPGFKPVPGDYDGDGKADIAIYNPNDGAWWIVPSGGGAPYGVGWGGPGFTPVPGDYDGDGKADVAIYEASTGAWWIIPSSGAPAYGVGWGGDPSDIPVTTNLPSIY